MRSLIFCKFVVFINCEIGYIINAVNKLSMKLSMQSIHRLCARVDDSETWYIISFRHERWCMYKVVLYTMNYPFCHITNFDLVAKQQALSEDNSVSLMAGTKSIIHCVVCI